MFLGWWFWFGWLVGSLVVVVVDLGLVAWVALGPSIGKSIWDMVGVTLFGLFGSFLLLFCFFAFSFFLFFSATFF